MLSINSLPIFEKRKELIKNKKSFRKGKFFSCESQKKQWGKRGMSILYVVFITSILLAIAFGISGILISQTKMLGEAGYSVNAFYAADSGAERALVNSDNPFDIGETFLPHGASYQAFVVNGGIGDCSAEFNYCIKSIGAYQGVKRAIEINY